VGIDALVVDPRRDHLHRARAGEHLAGLMAPVAHHQPAAALVALGVELRDVGLDLGLQGFGQHPPRTLTDDLIDQRGTVAGTAGVLSAVRSSNYGEHQGRTFPTGVGAPAMLEGPVQDEREGTTPPVDLAHPQTSSIARAA
jgi:hypothetical protein